jgi:ribosomal protein S18 acetylase RimI-like enzyme
MNTPVELCPFEPHHYDAVLALWQSTEGLTLREADSREGIGRYLACNPGLSFVALEGDALVGAVLCGQDGRRGYLQHLAVSPSHRRRGIGAALARRCLAALAEQGIFKCHLFVRVDNPEALAFWRRVGWTVRDDVVMMSRTVSRGEKV